MSYENFTIGVRSAQGAAYSISAESRAAGETTITSTIDVPEIAKGTQVLLEHRADREFLKGFGSALYDALIPQGPVREALFLTLGQAREAGRGVRLMLALEPPEVAALPWEYLYDPGRRHWFATSSPTVLVRYPKIQIGLTNFCVKPPFRLLFVAPESSGLGAASERKAFENALAGLRKVVDLHVLVEEVTVERLRQTLCDHQFHVVHFVGHAEFTSQAGDKSRVHLDGDSGGDRLVAGEDFARLFSGQKSLKLLFLNACEGAAVSSATPLIGIAPEILFQGVPGVVGLQFRVFDDVAVAFAGKFYQALFRGPQRGMVDVAMTEARNFLSVQFGEDPKANAAWGEPVLYLHAGEGMLFLSEAESLASVMSPAEARLDQRAAALVRDREDVSVDPASQAVVLRYVRRRQALRVATLVALTLAFSALAARGALKVFSIDQAVRNWLYARVLADGPDAAQRKVFLVTSDSEEPGDIPWRTQYAQLVRKLTEAGAKMIVFDIEFFDDGDRKVDTDLARAMENAREHGTHIIVVANSLAADSVPTALPADCDRSAPKVVDDRPPKMASAVAPVVSGSGVSEIGGGEGPDGCIDPAAARSMLWYYAAKAPEDVLGRVPGLAFAAYCRYVGINLRCPSAVKAEVGVPNFTTKSIRVGTFSVPFVETSSEEDDKRQSRILQGDLILEGAYRVRALPRMAHEDVLAKPPGELTGLKGKVVFVGGENDSDRFTLCDGSTVAGVRLHANIFESFFAGSVGWMPTGVETVLLVAMAVAGALLGGAMRWRLVVRGLAGVGVLIGYGFLTVFVVTDTRRVFDAAYPAGMFVIALLAQMWIEHRWYTRRNA